MAKQGLAALTGGIQEGYEFVDERRREKQVRELLGRENARLKNKAIAESSDVKRLHPEFSFEQYTPPLTWGQKALGWVKGLGQPQQMQALNLQEPTPAAPGQVPAHAVEPEPAVYKDGGSVRHMRKKYANGGRTLSPHQGGPGRVAFQPYADGGKVKEDSYWDDVKRTAAEYFDDTISNAMEGDRRIDAPRRQLAEAKDAYEVGSAYGEGAKEIGRSMLNTTKGLAKDVFVDNPVTQGAISVGKGALGFVGMSPGSEYEGRDDTAAAVQAIDADEPSEQAAESIAAQPGDANVTAGGGQSQQAAPSTPPPQQAVPSAQERGDREIDFSTEARQVMPEDIPAHSSKDWEEERKYWAASAIMKGEDPFEAMKKVDQQQLNGFARYAMQATALMDGGDIEGATRALYAAYQYFPNGKDVKFGVQTDKGGNRVIVAMGRNEESGESSGPPQVLDRNVISRMVENMQKPGALRAWTTDWQATEQKLWEQGFKQDELKEKGRHNRAMEEGYANRSAAIAAGGSGGMRQTDYDRAFGEFMNSQELRSLEDEPVADDLADVMARLYQKAGPQTPYPSIIKAVMAAYRDGSLDALREQYGLQ